MKKNQITNNLFLGFICLIMITACNSNTSKETTDIHNAIKDTVTSVKQNTIIETNKDTIIKLNAPSIKTDTENPKVLIYNFYITNRCVSCIAIEEATTKTLNTYFGKEIKSGRIKRQILNVDEEANKAISERYEAFGSGLFVTRVFKGKETTTDLTGDGFKYAKNKEEKFIEILKNKVSEYLK